MLPLIFVLEALKVISVYFIFSKDEISSPISLFDIFLDIKKVETHFSNLYNIIILTYTIIDIYIYLLILIFTRIQGFLVQ